MKLSSGAIAVFLAAASGSCAGFSHSPAAFGVSSSVRTCDDVFRPHRIRSRSSALSVKKSPSAKKSSNVLKVSSAVIEERTALTDALDPSGELLESAVEAASLAAARDSASTYLSNYKGQSGASVIYSKLVEHGVTLVNGYSGGAVLPLLDQFHEKNPRHADVDTPPIRWITNSNENSAGHIAEGYAKSAPACPSDGRQPAGVVVATSGPGVTNLITPLQDAICDGVPMVVLCGQAATNAPLDAFQQAPAVALTTPCTKWSYQIRSAAEIPFVMDYAFFIARHGRPGPVFVDLPKDLQNQVIDDALIADFATTVPVKSDFKTDLAEDDGAIRFAPRTTDEGGEARVHEHVVHVGRPELGILFETQKNGRLAPVTDLDLGGQEGVYQMDHHVSQMIFKMDSTENARTGPLSGGSQMTSEIFDLIRNAEKPFIIAGQGCNDCPEDLLRFAEDMNIPVATTLHGLGCFDERHPLGLNMLGMHGHPTPNYMIQEADLVLCIGSRFDDRITGRADQFIPAAKQAAAEGRGGIVHVDIRLSENSKQLSPTFFVHSTGKKFLKTMNGVRSTRMATDAASVSTDRTAWLERMLSLQKDFPVKVPKFPTEEVAGVDADGNDLIAKRTRMSAQSVVTELNSQILAAGKMDDCLFSTGVGVHQMVAAQLLTWTQPRQMITSGSLGTMGVALGFVIGCKLANGHKMCIAVDGDGSFNMTFTELKTVAEQKIPVKILIMDNESQMMVEYWQKLFLNERYLAVTNTVNPDYRKLADAFGIKNLYADCEEDLPEAMRQFLFDDPDVPVLMHVRIEKTPCLPLVAPGKAVDDMILEDVICEGLDPCSAPS